MWQHSINNFINRDKLKCIYFQQYYRYNINKNLKKTNHIALGNTTNIIALFNSGL